MAVATGDHKITLFWKGAPGLRTYNIYRARKSGGPYRRIARHVAPVDHHPGAAGVFMYSDRERLLTDTEYFYVVSGVRSGREVARSTEESALPEPGAVPWDSGDAARIVKAQSAQVKALLPPNIDPKTRKFVPAEVGGLAAQGPDGTMYTDIGGKPTAYAPPETP